LLGFGGGNCSGLIDVAASLAAHGVWQDFEVEAFVAQPLLAKANSSHDDSKETYIATRDVAATLTRGAESSGKGGYAGRRQEDDDNLVAHSLRGEGFDASGDGTGRGTPLVPVSYGISRDALDRSGEGEGGTAGERAGLGIVEGISPTLKAKGANAVATPYTLAIRGRDGEPDLEYRQDGTANAILTPNGGRAGIGVGAVAIQAGAMRENPDSGPDGVGVQADIACTLEARAEVQAVQERWAVRRLMPVECERLQGFPDGFTDIMPNGKPTADGPRYRALGNSMAVNVMRWIGQRIEMVDRLAAQEIWEAE
jgi:DNA (cytosine-5)-methyltransferase 1